MNSYDICPCLMKQRNKTLVKRILFDHVLYCLGEVKDSYETLYVTIYFIKLLLIYYFKNSIFVLDIKVRASDISFMS